ncbi:T9SS type A sorting domain-containing protein [bacterium]|nr:T9SS type A sorting domain-containing protein [bacterium]
MRLGKVLAWSVVAVFSLLAVMVVASSIDSSTERGMTEELLPGYIQDGIQLATTKSRTNTLQADLPVQPGSKADELDAWVTLESLNDSLSLLPGEHHAIKLNLPHRTLEQNDPIHPMSDLCMQALDYVPNWVRMDLHDNLVAIEEFAFLQDMIAQVILNTDDPYVDEMAFLFAHISPSIMLNGYITWDFELFHTNIQDLYAADEYLNYVQINDYGTSDDEDYYSTAEYTICNAEGDTVQVEIDRDIYYWYVVHPRISDEIPQFIDPSRANHPAPPPEGQLWRNFFLNEPDSGYASLREFLEPCDIMYGHLFNNNGEGNGAVGAVTRWLRSVLVFDSGQERPIQPVRIYRLHMGRCGEWQDITAAAARAALIPTLAVSSHSEDHVWNEFFDGARWKTWEPVNNYIGDSLAYQGWGKRFPALFSWRGDGFIRTETQRYHSNTTTLDVTILDANDRPVDGVRVKVLSEYLYGGIQLATAGWTDSEGRVSFTIGGGRNIYLNMSSPLGTDPANPNAGILAIENSDTEIEYEWTYNYDREIELNEPFDATLPDEPLNLFHISGDFSMMPELVSGQLFSNADFLAEIGTSAVDFFICNEENYLAFESGEAFEAYHFAREETAEFDFTLPDSEIWYVVFDNSSKVSNVERFRFNLELMIDGEMSVGEDAVLPLEFAVESVYPNPFNAETKLRFTLPQKSVVSYSVYNVQGREVLSGDMGNLEIGHHSLALNLNEMASGLYFFALRNEEMTLTQKLILMK